MNFRIAGTAAAILVGAGFACLAELALRRRSTDVFGWNESFLIGAGGCAAFLFPLSLVAPRRALDAVAVCIVLALAVIPIRIARAWRQRRGGQGRPAPPGAADIFSFAFVVFAVALFWVLNLRAAFAWDGFQIWATKAFLLFREGGLRPELWAGSIYEGRAGRAVNYPAIVPLFEALVARILGRFEFLDLKPVFVLFFASMLLSTLKAARSVTLSRLERFGVVAMIAALPAFTSRPMVGGNADLPVAACVAALAAAWLSPDSRPGRWNSAVPWLLGSLLAAKSEGLILFAVAIVSAAAMTPVEDPARRLRFGAGAVLVGAALLADRLVYLRWTAVPDRLIDSPNPTTLVRAFDRIPDVAALCARELVRVREWGFFWPAFVVASLLVVWASPGRQRSVALASLLGLAAYSAIFLMSSWPVRLHVAQAYGRLLAQIAPAAAITMLAAYRAVRMGPGFGAAGLAAPEPGSAGTERLRARRTRTNTASPSHPADETNRHDQKIGATYRRTTRCRPGPTATPWNA